MARTISIDIKGPASGLLKRLGEREGREPIRILRKAITLYAYMQDNYRGQTINIIDEKGSVKRLYVD